MTITVWGVVADATGQTWQRQDETIELRARRHGGPLEVKQPIRVVTHNVLGNYPGSCYAASHPAPIPIRWRHQGDPIGRATYLERREGRLVAVAELENVDESWLELGPKWSAQSVSTGAGRKILELSLTTTPASVGLDAVEWVPGAVHDAYTRTGNNAVRRAGQAVPRYDRRTAIDVVDLDLIGAATGAEHRAAAAVSPAIGAIRLLDRATRTVIVDQPPPGRGAGIIKLAFVNNPPAGYRRHNSEPVGRDIPAPGPGVTFRLARTSTADEALALIAEGVLDTVRPIRYAGRSGWTSLELSP